MIIKDETKKNKYHANMIDSITVEWLSRLTSQLYDLNDGEFAYPTSIVTALQIHTDRHEL